MADREMKNEEAIEILGGIRACYNIFDEYDEPKYAALSKAIFALKAEPTFEQLEEYCRKRCLVVVDGALFNEMKSRWSAEPKFAEWISVDNPPKVERYETLDILVTDGESITNGYATLDPFDDDSDEVEIHGRFPIDNKNIKWWMPLPKLPKEVKE